MAERILAQIETTVSLATALADRFNNRSPSTFVPLDRFLQENRKPFRRRNFRTISEFAMHSAVVGTTFGILGGEPHFFHIVGLYSLINLSIGLDCLVKFYRYLDNNR